jgi:hypothetical protein
LSMCDNKLRPPQRNSALIPTGWHKKKSEHDLRKASREAVIRKRIESVSGYTHNTMNVQ